MRLMRWLGLWLLLTGCTTHAVRCDGALRPINPSPLHLSPETRTPPP